ncbi:MAG: DUF1631 family protein [Pseudomonadales bacterium]|nr:DUF1631 family protein [Pseudomonadales bacterium]
MNNINVDAVVSQLQSIVLSNLQPSLAEFFTQFEQQLLDMADEASSNEQQWQLFAKARLLKKQEQQLSRRFEQTLIDRLVRFRTGSLDKIQLKIDDSPDLSLLADEALEKSIAISSLARRAEARNVEQLFALNQRLAILLGGDKLSDDGNPIGPLQLADIFLSTLSSLELSIKLQSIACRIFERAISAALSSSYQSANKLLIEQDILPNFKYSVTKPAASEIDNKPRATASQHAASSEPVAKSADSVGSSPAVNMTPDQPKTLADNIAASSAAATESSHLQQITQDQFKQHTQASLQAVTQSQSAPVSATGDAYQQQLLNNIADIQRRQLQPANQQATDIPSPDATFNASQNLQQVISTVENFQQQANHIQQLSEQKVEALSLDQMQSVNQSVLQAAQEHHASIDNQQAIDLVGRIFEYMLSDKQLPDAVKAVLSYLHTPYLKIAMADPSFIRDTKHCAKELLDALADAGRQWVNDDGKSQLQVFPKIKEIVRHLLIEYQGETSTVDELLQDMLAFNAKVSKKALILDQRAQSKAEGEEHMRSIKKAAKQSIASVAKGFKLTKPVRILIALPLSDHLTMLGLRYGVDSEHWQQSLQLVADVIASVEANAVDQDQGSRERFNDNVIYEVELALKSISFDHAKARKLIQLLMQAQTDAIAGQGLTAPADADQQEIELDEEFQEQAITEQEDCAIKELASLDFGTWLEFSDFEFIGIKRAKVAWYNAQSNRFMLSDNTGQFRKMLSAIDLAKAKLAGKVQIEQWIEKPFFERALEFVLLKLKTAV